MARRDNDKKKLYAASVTAAVLLAGGIVTFVVLGSDDDAAPQADTKEITSTVEGYRGYTVGKTWFDHPGLESTTPADLDGDGTASKDEKERSEEAKATSEKIISKIAPAKSKNVTSSLLTPASHDWWLFASSQSDYMKLWHWDAPTEANWYAVTWARQNGAGKDKVHYPMVHVAFESNEKMIAWVETQDFTQGSVQPIYRGTTVSLVPSFVNPDQEKLTRDLADLPTTKVDTGYWNIDFDKQIAYDAAESPDPDSYQLFWRASGFTEGASWSATSDTPARWAGTVTGWNKEFLDVEMAAWAINRTASEDTAGLSGASFDVLLSDPKRGVSFGQTNYAPESAPDDADLVLATTEEFRGQMTRLGATMGSVTGLTSRWIKGSTMVVEQWLGTPPEGETSGPEDTESAD